MVKKTTHNPLLDPVGYDINTDPKRWQKLTGWRVVAEIVGTTGPDSMTGKVAIPPVQHGVLFPKLSPDAKLAGGIGEMLGAKPAFTGLGHASGAHFVGEGRVLQHSSDVTVHIDRDLKPSEVIAGVGIAPDVGRVYAIVEVADMGNGPDKVEIDMPEPTDPVFPLPATGTVFTLDTSKTPVEGVDGGILRVRIMPAPAFYITLESTGCVDKGNERQHVIQPSPKMPDMLVRMTALGLTPEEDKTLTREVKLTVTYIKGNRKDKNIFKDTVTGPEWRPNWGGKFYGGDIELEVSATLPWGEKMTTKLAKGTHVICGKNPARADIRAALSNLYTQAIGYQESIFTQFANGKPGAAFQADLATVLRSFDDGYGIGQLTNLLPSVPHITAKNANGDKIFAPTAEQLWNWQANTAATAQMAQIYRAQGAKLTAATYKKFPKVKVPKLTEDQLDEIGWQFYNAGMGKKLKNGYTYSHQYWQYDTKANKWKEHAVGSYVGDCRKWRAAVRANRPPAGWN